MMKDMLQLLILTHDVVRYRSVMGKNLDKHETLQPLRENQNLIKNRRKGEKVAIIQDFEIFGDFKIAISTEVAFLKGCKVANCRQDVTNCNHGFQNSTNDQNPPNKIMG